MALLLTSAVKWFQYHQESRLVSKDQDDDVGQQPPVMIWDPNDQDILGPAEMKLFPQCHHCHDLSKGLKQIYDVAWEQCLFSIKSKPGQPEDYNTLDVKKDP